MLFELLALLLLIAVLAAEIWAISLFIKIGMAKGYSMENRAALWFIGVVAPLGPIVIGIYVSALPDRAKLDEPDQVQELPAIDAPAPNPATAPSSTAAIPTPPAKPAANSDLPTL